MRRVLRGVAAMVAVLLYQLLNTGRHWYVSTYCQHGRCGDCREFCKCCGSPCLCLRVDCDHVRWGPQAAT